MVRQIHSLLRVRPRQIRWPLLRARETGVGGAKWRFPDLAELVQDVGHLGLIGVVVHENDCALLREDELGQRRPVADGHGDFGRDVGPFGQARGLEGLGIVADAYEVGVADEDGDDVVGVR